MTTHSGELNLALKAILKGASTSLMGSILTLLFVFGSKVLIARTFTKAEYGTYSLVIAICGFVGILATLGFTDGVPRCIAYIRGKKENEKIKDFVTTSILITLFSGIIFLLIVYLSSDSISLVFHNQEVALPLKVLSLSIPFSLLAITLDSVFRGFDNVKPGVYFNKFFSRITLFILILVIYLFKLGYLYVFYAILLSAAMTTCLFVVYFLKTMRSLFNFRFNVSVAITILSFSVPLLGVSILVQIMAWTDTFMLGVFKNSVDIGLYNSANPIARFILAPILMLNSIYIPVVSGMYSKGLNSDIKRTYNLTTKWLCFLTYPLFLLLLLEPGKVLGYTFGWKYTPASNVLRILALGFMVGNILGPNYATLVALGESRFIMLATIFATVLNVGLNVILIPTLGIVGAAIATSTSEIGVSVLRWLKVFLSNGSIPVSKNLVKPLAVLTPAFLLLLHVGLKIWFVFPLSYLCLALAILLTKSLEAEDWEIINTIMERIKAKL